MQSPYLEIVAATIGLVVGSFLNVLALRSLSGESWISPWSNCPKCKHRLGILDLIPILSYVCLSGRCRYCKEKISWHYAAVEATTAGLFAAIVHHFSQATFSESPERAITTIAMLFFASVLIAVTVTDFREKLIPHEITYPTILFGLIFSLAVRHDLIGALAGVGISYILFDFIAFYGLKYYLWAHPELKEGAETEAEAKKEAKAEAEAEANTDVEVEEIDDEIDKSFDIVRPTARSSNATNADEDDEPFEVMGGGDAVLSAVLAAWLGWEKLVVALVIGFMVGAIMGAVYLIHELVKQKRLDQVRKPALLGFTGFGLLFTLAMIALSFIFPSANILVNPQVWLLDLIVALAGTTLGVIWSGNSIAKPFPFGPALAFGGLWAVFLINLMDHNFIK